MKGGKPMTAPVREKGFSMVGADGGFWVAPEGTAAPDGLDAPTGLWVPGGAASDDGFIYGIAESSTAWTPFGTTSPWRTEVTSSVKTMQFTSWEVHRPIVISLWERIQVADLVEDGDNLVKYASTASPTPDPRAFLFDFIDGLTVHRYYMPHGEVSDRGNVTNKQTEQVGNQMTVTAYPDDLNNLVYHTFFTAQRQDALLA
jgi:hypothetical protein